MMPPQSNNDPLSVASAREVVKSALEGQLDILIACLRLDDLRPGLPGVPKDLLNVFTGVASEIDSLPLEEQRRFWSPDVLKAKDTEAAQYRRQIAKVVTAALGRLEKILADPEMSAS